MVGGAGGVVPFQNKLSLFPAPHGSLAFAAQGMSQSVAVAFVVPGVMLLAQSVHPKAKVSSSSIEVLAGGKVTLTALTLGGRKTELH
jgi:hypothetical protein